VRSFDEHNDGVPDEHNDGLREGSVQSANGHNEPVPGGHYDGVLDGYCNGLYEGLVLFTYEYYDGVPATISTASRASVAIICARGSVWSTHGNDDGVPDGHDDDMPDGHGDGLCQGFSIVNRQVFPWRTS
jgi:hypothetical protein